MRRVNKILMATVAILLCLVLSSTSVVSGIFAKYVIEKQAQISAVIQKFGVKVYLIPDTEKLAQYGAQPKATYDKDSASMSFETLKPIPGLDLSEALKIRFDGETTVPLKVTVTFTFSYSTGNFIVEDHENVGNIPESCEYSKDGLVYMLPVGIKFGTQNIVVEEKADGTTVENISTILSTDYADKVTPHYLHLHDNKE